MTERELVERSRMGDREASRELYARTCDRVYRLLVRMTHSPDKAFDLAQDTYLKAFQSLGQFDGRSSLSTWLYRIAVNEALMSQRREKRARLLNWDETDATAKDSGLERMDTALDVDTALAGLDPDDRAILLLRYQEGLDYQAIADVLECPAGTVASRLNRARARLRERLVRSYGRSEESEHGKHLSRCSSTAPGTRDCNTAEADAAGA